MSPDMVATLGTWGPILIMVGVFYLLLYRPQKKEQKRRQEMLDSLKTGDEVITIGGIYGIITALDEKSVHLKIANQVEIKAARSAIASLTSSEA